MPPLPPVPSVLKMELSGTCSSSVWANILYFLYSSGPPTLSDLTTMAPAVLSAWASNVGGMVNLETALTKIQLIDLASSTGATYQLIANQVGTNSGVVVPASASVVIKNIIGRRYRGGHPKTFLIGGIASELADQDSWSNTKVVNTHSNWLAFINAILHTFGSTTIASQVNVSYYKGFTNITTTSGRMKAKPTLRPSPVVDVISGYVVETKVGSQRRRTSHG